MCAFQIIDKHRPRNTLLALVTFGIAPLLLKAVIGWHCRARMRLPDHHVYEVHLRSPLGIELFERLDRAHRDRSCKRAKMQQRRPAAQRTEAQACAIDTR